MQQYSNIHSWQEHWLPFTGNRDFKADPRLVVASKGMYLTNHKGGQVIDGSSALFCTPLGHGRSEIADAVHRQLLDNDYIPHFQLGHPDSFNLAHRLAALLPDGLNRLFFCSSGSESIDTAMKIILAYYRAKGQGHRNRFVGRERAYHGVNFGGLSLSGMVRNREQFGLTLPNVVLMRHSWTGQELFVKGQPQHQGVELANDLERFCQTYGASTIAAVFVEPVAGSTGVLVPPVGYLQRLRQICDQYGILLVFDEVITGLGRLGTPFAAQRFGVIPDMITMAKALTNGAIPMGAVAVRDDIYQTIIDHAAPDAIELFHGYTYSAHPVACAAALACLDVVEAEDLWGQTRAIEAYFIDAVFSLSDHPLVKDIRAIGLMAGVELHPDPSGPGLRGTAFQKQLFWDGCHVKFTGDVGIIAPAFIAQRRDIDEIVDKFRGRLDKMA